MLIRVASLLVASRAPLRRMQIILFHTLTFTRARSKVVKATRTDFILKVLSGASIAFAILLCLQSSRSLT